MILKIRLKLGCYAVVDAIKVFRRVDFVQNTVAFPLVRHNNFDLPRCFKQIRSGGFGQRTGGGFRSTPTAVCNAGLCGCLILFFAGINGGFVFNRFNAIRNSGLIVEGVFSASGILGKRIVEFILAINTINGTKRRNSAVFALFGNGNVSHNGCAIGLESVLDLIVFQTG